MPAVSDPITAEQLLVNPDWRRGVELVEGRLIVMEPGGYAHSAAAIAVAVVFGNWIRQRRLGAGLSGEPGFILGRGPDTVRAPDFAFIRSERVPDPPPDGYPQMAPDFAVEIVGKDDRVAKVHDKARMWLGKGVGEVWVVDPRERTATIHLPGLEPEIFGEDEQIEAAGPLTGFACRVADLFGIQSPRR